MHSQPRYLTSSAAGLIAGFISGMISAGIFALSVHWRVLAHHDSVVFYSPGPIFGIAISIYCWLFFSRWSILRSLGFIAICTGTEFAMFLLAYLASAVTYQWKSAWITWLNLGFPGFIIGYFVAGTVGAFLVLGVAQVFFFTSRGVMQILATSLYWSPIGGILSTAGWTFGSYTLSHMWRLTGVSALYYPFEAVFLAWQSGMGFALGVILQYETSPG